MINRSIVLIVGLTVVLSACKKEGTEISSIPNVQVNVQLNINNPAYFDISIPGGWVYHSAGSRGLIIYRRSNDVFIAMDRHCPYEPQDGCAVAVDSGNVIAEDACCGSQFTINDGSLHQGPATQSLRTYNTTFDGTILRIFN